MLRSLHGSLLTFFSILAIKTSLNLGGCDTIAQSHTNTNTHTKRINGYDVDVISARKFVEDDISAPTHIYG